MNGRRERSVSSTNVASCDSQAQRHLVETIARIAQLDQAAFAELYDRTNRMVYGVVKRILNHPSIAEEITIDVYLQIWRKAGQYRAERGGPRTWLLMIARSRAIGCLRSRRREMHDVPLNSEYVVDYASLSVDRIVSDNARQKFVRRALDSLVPAQREVIELAFFCGLSHSEIATKLRQPLGTVKGRIRLGLLRLRDSFCRRSV